MVSETGHNTEIGATCMRYIPIEKLQGKTHTDHRICLMHAKLTNMKRKN